MASDRTARPLTEADVDQVADLERRVFPDPWPRQAFLDALSEPGTGAFVVKRTDGLVAGHGICRSISDEGEILNLAIEPALRGLGLGSHLLDSMLGWLAARGARAVFLEVRRSNQAAVRLYQKAGFATSGVRRAYYRLPVEDALTMGLDMSSWNAIK